MSWEMRNRGIYFIKRKENKADEREKERERDENKEKILHILLMIFPHSCSKSGLRFCTCVLGDTPVALQLKKKNASLKFYSHVCLA